MTLAKLRVLAVNLLLAMGGVFIAHHSPDWHDVIAEEATQWLRAEHLFPE